MLRRLTTIGGALLFMAGAAGADIVSLSAMGFVHYDPSGASPDPTPTNGTLSSQLLSDYFAPVDFPVDGNNICKLTIVYGDANATEGISAALYRKKIGGVLLATPQLVAKVTSTGSAASMRLTSQATIKQPLIDEANYFYYVQVTPQNFNTVLVGVQIEHKPACP